MREHMTIVTSVHGRTPLELAERAHALVQARAAHARPRSPSGR